MLHVNSTRYGTDIVFYMKRRIQIAGISTRTSVADPGCLSRILVFSIPDPKFSIPDPGSEFFHPGSEFFPSRIRIFPSRICIKELTQWFQSSRKYDPGCSSRTQIPDPGVKKAPDPGRIRNTGPNCRHLIFTVFNFFLFRRK